MDIGSAFTFMFDDEEWVKKLAIGGGIAILAIILTFVLIGIVLYFPLAGYILETIKRVRDKKPGLPEWTDFGNLFVKGLMLFLIGLIYTLPILLVLCLIFGLQFGFMQADNDVIAVLSIVAVCLWCLFALFMLLVHFIMPAAIIRYAQYDTFGSAFQFGEMWSFIRKNIGDYIIAVLLSLVAGTLAALGFIVCLVGIFFTMFWAGLVQANLYGQLARETS